MKALALSHVKGRDFGSQCTQSMRPEKSSTPVPPVTRSKHLKMVAMVLEPRFKLISEHQFRFKIFKIEICLVFIYLCSS